MPRTERMKTPQTLYSVLCAIKSQHEFPVTFRILVSNYTSTFFPSPSFSKAQHTNCIIFGRKKNLDLSTDTNNIL